MKFINTKIKTLIMTSIVLLAGLSACSSDPVSDIGEDQLSSLLVANEGNFADGNGSITSFNVETGQALQQRFNQINGRPLAGIIQALVEDENRIFIVANSTNKIEVVEKTTLESLGTITFENGVAPAGFALASENKGYVSDLFSDSLHVVNLENFETIGTQIGVGDNPRGMIVVGNRLFVANSGFGDGNTISVVDTGTDMVTANIQVGTGPIKLIADDEGMIWVVSGGKRAFDENFIRDPQNDIPGQIDILDAATATVVASIETGGFPKSLAVSTNIGTAWVVNEGAVQQIDIDGLQLMADNLVDRNFNGIGYSSSENLLYLAHSRGYDQSGQAIIYDLQGAAVDSFQAGIAPFDFLFRVEQN